MELTAALQKLDQLQRKQLAYSHAMGLIDYDGMTAAPSGTAANRAETLGILAEERYTSCPQARKLWPCWMGCTPIWTSWTKCISASSR